MGRTPSPHAERHLANWRDEVDGAELYRALVTEGHPR
jgi:hypothetical protein